MSIAVRQSFWGFSQLKYQPFLCSGGYWTFDPHLGGIPRWCPANFMKTIVTYHTGSNWICIIGISWYIHISIHIYIYNHKKFRHQLRQLWITTLQAPYAALPSTDLARRFWASHLTFSNSASAMILWIIHTLFTHMFNPCMGNIPINIIYIYIYVHIIQY